MTAEEYQQLVHKIHKLYEGRIDEYAKEMRSELQKDLLAIMRIWKVEHGDAPPPPVRFLRFAKGSVSSNQANTVSQKQRIRQAQPESSSISKVLGI